MRGGDNELEGIVVVRFIGNKEKLVEPIYHELGSRNMKNLWILTEERPKKEVISV